MTWFDRLLRLAKLNDSSAPQSPQCKDVPVSQINTDQPDLNREVEPPWIAFPGPPNAPLWMGPWRQGAGEAYLKFDFYPFYYNLSVRDRIAYLDKWKAPPNWREKLLRGVVDEDKSDDTEAR